MNLNKAPQKQKYKIRWLHRLILPNFQRRNNTCSSQTIPKNCRGRNLSIYPSFFFFEEGTLLNSLHKASKTLTPKSDKLPHTYTHKITGNITDEHRCKNPE